MNYKNIGFIVLLVSSMQVRAFESDDIDIINEDVQEAWEQYYQELPTSLKLKLVAELSKHFIDAKTILHDLENKQKPTILTDKDDVKSLQKETKEESKKEAQKQNANHDQVCKEPCHDKSQLVSAQKQITKEEKLINFVTEHRGKIAIGCIIGASAIAYYFRK